MIQNLMAYFNCMEHFICVIKTPSKESFGGENVIYSGAKTNDNELKLNSKQFSYVVTVLVHLS